MPAERRTSRRERRQPTSADHGIAAAETVLRGVRDGLEGDLDELARAASHLPQGHPFASELRDFAASLRTVRVGVARIAIWLEDERRKKTEARDDA